MYVLRTLYTTCTRCLVKRNIKNPTNNQGIDNVVDHYCFLASYRPGVGTVKNKYYAIRTRFTLIITVSFSDFQPVTVRVLPLAVNDCH